MEFITRGQWDQKLWDQMEPVYHEGFPPHGRKPVRVIRSAVEKGGGFLHAGREREAVAAMALTGKLAEIRALLIDYIAVGEAVRSGGMGHRFLNEIKAWAQDQGLEGIVIEIECEETPVNRRRSSFWEKNGFQRVGDYVHQYIWVPEPYQAMVYAFDSSAELLRRDGETLFRLMGGFHAKAYSGH
ncbi:MULTISPECIES: GNAT family N-acetyltransferase [Paenibacillus]|uniref:GNAT family N-acetyltransferase n=1 Tax=Paenibacillus TaxID=44249 RepID=UPI0022B8FB37|nr:GNAT family N-acetyltransferase [Paenibacillus caseinilyticus]MCZ8519927.1 GNAT family N-acetyltransferase [Paenibacillus caseinilyticus]